jgi:hypothetical protein
MASSLHRACNRAFSGLTAFDRHLRWHKGPPWVSCREPLDVGLVWSEARQSWATHIGPLTGADGSEVRGHQPDPKSAESANCYGAGGIR